MAFGSKVKREDGQQSKRSQWCASLKKAKDFIGHNISLTDITVVLPEVNTLNQFVCGWLKIKGHNEKRDL